jgi:MoxR-like ATPase
VSEIDDVRKAGEAILDEVSRAVVGKRSVLEQVLVAVLAGGHVLLEDVPGVAKTLIARSFADVMGLSFSRIQFTPDLMPSDVTGSAVFDQRTNELVFKPGPLFANLLLGDEINRAPPKTQAAMLEAMQESQVTVEGTAHRLAAPFIVIATQNPIEYEGTYPLPEAQLDRFLVRLNIGYPQFEHERELLQRRAARQQEAVELSVVASETTIVAMQEAVETVFVADEIYTYMVELVAATRAEPRLELGASPRGSLALLRLARSKAALDGRDWVSPEDVKAVAVPALAHRVVLNPELWVQRITTADVVADALARVPVPAAVPKALEEL